MLDAIFHVETVTPLFLAGADGMVAELRPPTLRGQLRYWYRALLGGLLDGHAPPQLLTAEQALFGSTTIASPVSLRLSPPSHPPSALPPTSPSGMRYLFWSKLPHSASKSTRTCFQPGTTFQCIFSSRTNAHVHLQQLLAAFWLLTHLGTVGARSRRCAGSLSALPLNALSTPLPFHRCTTITELQQQLTAGIAAARSIVRSTLSSNTNPLPHNRATFDQLSATTCNIWLLQNARPWTSVDLALQQVGSSLQTHIHKLRKPGHTIFSSPLPDARRRVSPLLLRLTPLQQQGYVAVAVLFKTVASDGSMQDFAPVEDWLASFAGRMQVLL